MSTTATIALLQQQRELLRVEYQEEKEAYRLHSEAMGLTRKVTRGDAWYPLHEGRTYYNKDNQYCIEVPWERSALDYLLQTAAEACNVSGFFSYPNFS